MISDTVGFVRDLPHELVEAFRSTLEEVADADLLVHLVDASDGDPELQITTVRMVMDEVGASDVEEIIVFNKIDAIDETTLTRLRQLHTGATFISAATGEGVPELLEGMVDGLRALTIELDLTVPYSRGDVLADIHASGDVLKQEHTDSGTNVVARLPSGDAHRFREFVA
jgi:GTP-binding protein HflX